MTCYCYSFYYFDLQTQTCENISALLSSDATTDSDTISDNDLPIALRKGILAHLTLSFALYLIHTYLSLFMPLFFL